MKQHLGAMVLCLLLLSACGTAAKPTETLSGTVVEQEGNTLLLYVAEHPSSDLFFISLKDIPLTDAEGTVLPKSAFTPGSLVSLGYDGTVMETYPAQITANEIQLTAPGNELLLLYEQALYDLYQTDSALQDGASYLALDLTKVESLTWGEKAALTYLVGERCGLEAVQGTYETLCASGEIDRETLQFSNGLLLTLSEERIETAGQVVFSLSKWRSGDGAYGMEHCTGVLKNGVWQYTAAQNWIS